MRAWTWAAISTAVVLASTLILSSRIAVAADPEDLIREGVALRRGGEDAAALQKFTQAFQIGGSERARAQIGLAEQALGRWAMAFDHLSRALEAKNDPWIKKNRPLIAESLNRVSEHVGQIEILGGTAGAEVRIDGVSRGKLPLGRPIAASTGMATIDLVAPGFISIQRTTVVRGRETIRESFDALAPLPTREAPPAIAAAKPDTAAATHAPAPEIATAVSSPFASAGSEAATPGSPAPQPNANATPTGSEKNSPDRGGDKPSGLRTGVKWVAFGLGAAALGVGIFGAVQQNQAGNNFAGGCGVDPQQNVVLLPGSTRTIADCRSLKNQVDSNYRIEIIGLVGAGIFAAAGVVLWLTEPASTSTSSGTETAALSCTPGMTPGHGPAVGCTLTF